MATSRDLIFNWLQVLDELTYYELFGIRQGATPDQIRIAFHDFCDIFHPDRHFTRAVDERGALSTIFKRGNEAYFVLSDVAFREQYDAQLATTKSERPPRVSFSPLSRLPSSRAPRTAVSLEDSVRSVTARPYARHAEELVRKGDLRQAKLQLVMANHLDPGNEALGAALRDVEARLDPWRASKPPK